MHKIDFIEHNPTGLLREFFVKLCKFARQSLRFRHGIRAFRIERRAVNDVQEQIRAGQVTQELKPKTRAFARAFDQTRNIGDHKTLFRPHAHHAQMRMQSRKGIVRNLRTGIGNGRNEGGLTGVWHPEKPNVRQDFEFQLQLTVFALFTGRRLTRRPIRTRLKVQVS